MWIIKCSNSNTYVKTFNNQSVVMTENLMDAVKFENLKEADILLDDLQKTCEYKNLRKNLRLIKFG